MEDAALAMSALAGYDSRDPLSIDSHEDYVAATRRSIRDWKVAYSPDLDVYPVDPEVSRVVFEAVSAFSSAGAHVEEVKLGIEHSQMELAELWCRLIMPPGLQALDQLKQRGIDLMRDHREDFPPEYLGWYERTREMSVLDFFNDNIVRSEIYSAIQRVLNDYDVLVSPTLACLPVDNESDGNTKGPTMLNGEYVEPLIGWCMTYFTNFSGHPSASIPAGLSSDGLPVGMQIVGRRYADADEFAASAAFERVRPWNKTYSICENRVI